MTGTSASRAEAAPTPPSLEVAKIHMSACVFLSLHSALVCVPLLLHVVPTVSLHPFLFLNAFSMAFPAHKTPWPSSLPGLSRQSSRCCNWTLSTWRRRREGCKHHAFHLCGSFAGPWAREGKLGKYLFVDCKDKPSVPLTLLLSLSPRKRKSDCSCLGLQPQPWARPSPGSCSWAS